ncbi:hypothetical protein, partial [Frigidibacter sp. SD6-1]|uniref:hypothetical protein n=1 Tax=Frigidibacter sp. SD6-1 TaxID=3032581 RepID=UPI0024DF37FD
MIAVKTIDDLLAEIESSTVEEADRLAGYVYYKIKDRREIDLAAECLFRTHGSASLFVSYQAACLFKASGNMERYKSILQALELRGHAPAIHALGCMKRDEGKLDEALALFKRSMDLGYLVGRAFFYWTLCKQARWPKRWYYWWRYKWAWNEAQYEKKVRGLPDLSSTW